MVTGFNALLIMDLEWEIGVVVLSNTGYMEPYDYPTPLQLAGRALFDDLVLASMPWVFEIAQIGRDRVLQNPMA